MSHLWLIQISLSLAERSSGGFCHLWSWFDGCQLVLFNSAAHTFYYDVALCGIILQFDIVSFSGREAALITSARHGDAYRSWVFHSVTASCLLIVPAMLVWEENVLIKSSFLLFQETYHMNIK